MDEVSEKCLYKKEPRSRSETLEGNTEKVKVGCGNLYITINGDDIGICEVFTKTGGCSPLSEAASRLISIAMRAGVEAEYIIEQLKGIKCPNTTQQKDIKVLSCPDAIGRALERVLKETKK